MELSIIIVNYNTGEMLYNLLKSIIGSLTIQYQVIVADNGSTDSSFSNCHNRLKDERIIYLPLRSNYGFAKANNIAANVARGELLHFLNPDTLMERGLDGDYLKCMDEPQYVYITPLKNRDGSIENGKMPLPFLGNLFLWNFNRSRARCWYKGASVIISAENFRRAGRWSEEYFMYAEDLELFYRLDRLGIGIRSTSTPILHYGGGSTSAIWSRRERESIVQRSFRLFYRRNSNLFQYIGVKLYYLVHYLFKNPRRVTFEIGAWIKSYGRQP